MSAVVFTVERAAGVPGLFDVTYDDAVGPVQVRDLTVGQVRDLAGRLQAIFEWPA